MKERQRWQPEEDSLLRNYVKQYGPKEWNLISQRTGKHLDRDPKSCLERWKNYLKPGIKKGSLTPDEQTLVIALQAKYGNKWKKIAAEVPGRTAKRLGKWWEVFKEKQIKEIHRAGTSTTRLDFVVDPPVSSSVSGCGSPQKAIQGSKYDHILDTFAEKYVQQPAHFFSFQSLPLPPAAIMPNIEQVPVLSLGSVPVHEPVTASSTSSLPPWMNTSTMVITTTATSSSSSTPSPSVSLTLSPTEPVVLDPVQPEMCHPGRFSNFQQMGTLVQYCKELEEVRQSWVQHKKEATWRLNRLEQQLESEKARKRRDKMEEIEAKIRCLREEEMSFVGRIESEYKEQLMSLQREAEAKEVKLMEAWGSKHAKLAMIVEQIGIHQTHGSFLTMPKDLH